MQFDERLFSPESFHADCRQSERARWLVHSAVGMLRRGRGPGRGRRSLGRSDPLAMPYKANAGRRHHIPWRKRRVINWAVYDATCAGAAASRSGSPTRRSRAGEQRHAHTRWSAALLGPGDHDSADVTRRLPLGAAPDRRAARLHPPATRAGAAGSGSFYHRPAGRCICWWTARD